MAAVPAQSFETKRFDRFDRRLRAFDAFLREDVEVPAPVDVLALVTSEHEDVAVGTATEVFELFIPASLRPIHLPGGGDDLVRRSCEALTRTLDLDTDGPPPPRKRHIHVPGAVRVQDHFTIDELG